MYLQQLLDITNNKFISYYLLHSKDTTVIGIVQQIICSHYTNKTPFHTYLNCLNTRSFLLSMKDIFKLPLLELDIHQDITKQFRKRPKTRAELIFSAYCS
eukprot:NODE_361_length_10144_cov_0.288402.p7 type:complete len:100 gc:universal NODE_361_length_10144_cov_0.288402:9909-9610(-)